MSRKISAVIGANWGDEGKGMITHALSDNQTIVVRSNGGAQAGHTVITQEGKRHVFHHVGSGTFKGAATFLSQYFVLNPILFREEMEKLDISPTIMVDPLCYVTTPFDMLLNQALERKRQALKHGSCGLGFNETIHRYTNNKCRLFYGFDLKLPNDILKSNLYDIRNIYVPKRMKELGLTFDDESLTNLFDDRLIENFIDDINYMISKIRFTEFKILSNTICPTANILFEGAQGLQLDMDNFQFPHVTRSKTGVHNILNLMKQANIEDPLDVYYVTRPYITRHGNGPLPHEYPIDDFISVVDETNIENEFQGKMRFSCLDLDCLKKEITKDIKEINIPHTKNLVITCLEQLKSNAQFCYVSDQKKEQTPFPYTLFQSLKVNLKLDSVLLFDNRKR